MTLTDQKENRWWDKPTFREMEARVAYWRNLFTVACVVATVGWCAFWFVVIWWSSTVNLPR